MNIVCPHCMTSYAVDPANFAETGRRVRCVRCHEVWHAIPQEMAMAASSGYGEDAGPGSGADHQASTEWRNGDTPHVESPSISADWSDADPAQLSSGTDQSWPSLAQQDEAAAAAPAKPAARLKGTGKSFAAILNPLSWAKSMPGAFNLPVACMALSAVVFALLAWRADVVRLMPQTAAFYKMIGMGVNLRGLAFEDVKISTEMVNNKPVLLIEGAIIDVARRSVEIPRLRFIVRDANGLDIYAWNAVLEQPVINPGEKAWFKTRLASPPAEGREIAVRFFHKLDVAAGGT